MTMQVSTSLPQQLADADADARLSAFRSPPHNIDAEKALLGAIFANNRAYEAVSEFLRPDHFAIGQNGRIFEACAKLVERGQIADPVTLKNFFEQDQSLAEVGGPAYLAELASSAVGLINAGEYGRLIYDLHLRRELINLGEDVVERAYQGDIEETAVNQIERAEQGLYDLATRGEYEGGFQPFKTSVIDAIEMAEKAHKREGSLAGVGTGFTDIDKTLGGASSDLIILAGRPQGQDGAGHHIAFNAVHPCQVEGRRRRHRRLLLAGNVGRALASASFRADRHLSDRMRKASFRTTSSTAWWSPARPCTRSPSSSTTPRRCTVSALRTRRAA